MNSDVREIRYRWQQNVLRPMNKRKRVSKLTRAFVRKAGFFAEFIASTYPNARRIADVAGGHGWLALVLANDTRSVVVIDPYTRKGPLRSRGIPNPIFPGRIEPARVMRSRFTLGHVAWFDVLASFRSCGATPELAEAAVQGHAVAIVPCCQTFDRHLFRPREAPETTLRRYWRERGVRWHETPLPGPKWDRSAEKILWTLAT